MEGPYQACIKFSEVHAMVQNHFSTASITAQETSKILHQAFPTAKSERSTVVFGVRRRASASHSHSTPSSTTSNVPTSEKQVEEELHTMQVQNAALKERVAQLEMQNDSLQSVVSTGTISLSVLDSQIRHLISLMDQIPLNGLRNSLSML